MTATRRVFLCAFFFGPPVVFALEPSKGLPLSETPADVRTAIQTAVGEGTLGHIKEVNQNRKITYEVELTTKEGQTRAFTLSANGTLQNTKIALAETPATVQQAIDHLRVNENKLVDIQKSADGDDISYAVRTMEKNGRNRTFTMDGEGKLQIMEIALPEAPEPVQSTVKKQLGLGKLESIEKDFDLDATRYDIKMIRSDGQEREFTVRPDGRLESLQVSLGEVPAAVQQSIIRHLARSKLEYIEKDFDSAGVIYEIYMSLPDGQERTFELADNGVLRSREVMFSETPAAVQKAIQGQIGNGKILEIDRSFVDKKGILSYEVLGEKNGKEYNFSVGPKGQFLGMDK